MVLSAKVQAYLTTSGTALASIGGALGTFSSFFATNTPQYGYIGWAIFGVGLILKFEKQLESALGTPEGKALVDSIGNDIEALKNSHGLLSERIAALEAANTDVPAATATAINPTAPAPTQNA